MPVIFGGALVSLLVLVGVFGLLVLHRTAGINLRAFLASFAEKSGFRRWFFRAIGLTALVGAIDHVVHRFRQAIATALAPTLPLIGRWLQALGSAAHWTYKEYGDWATHWADNFAWFRHRTLPHEINRKVVPVKIAAAHAGALAGRVNEREKADRKRFARGIDRLKRETGLLAGILLGIDVLVRGSHAHAHHHTHTHDIPRIRDRDIPRLKDRTSAHGHELARHRSRLKRIEKLLAELVGGLVVYRVLARVAPWLFCRNWKVLGRAICGMRPDSLANLLALLLGAWALSDLRRTARLAEDALDFVTGVVWDAASIGDRPKGRFTID